MIKPIPKPLSAELEGDELVIRIGAESLAHCIQNCGELENSIHIPDPIAFAKKMARYVMYDDETGATVIHKALDKAAIDMFESGEDEILDIDG